MNTTESESDFDKLEEMSILELLESINSLDLGVALIVKSSLGQIEALVGEVVLKMKEGGRLFYVGAGTSGRLGVIDSAECPPTFGVSSDLVVGIIAGGDPAIRKAVEGAEDDVDACWEDLQAHGISNNDFVIGIAASGSTPYVLEGLKASNENGVGTGCIVCNDDSPIAAEADFPVEVVVGPEFITGSTRMKAGTVQKLVLNMISTSVMIELGHVYGNKMVDMKLSNDKLKGRGVRVIMDELEVSSDEATKLLREAGSVREALKSSENFK